MKKFFREKEPCPDCQPAPAPHFILLWAAILNHTLTPVLRPFDIIRKRVSPLFQTRFGERIILEFIKFLSFIGILRILDRPTETDNWRAKCFWEEADRRGIKMSRIALLKWPSNIYMATFKDNVFVFEGLPRPKGNDNSESLEWMDNKGIMREKFTAAGIPIARGGMAGSLKEALSIFENIGGTAIVKPSLGSRSRHTTTGINNAEELAKAFYKARMVCPWVVVEEELQ